MNISSSNIFLTIQKIFDGELFIRTLSTTLLQIFCDFMLHFKVIFESLKVPDDTCRGDV